MPRIQGKELCKQISILLPVADWKLLRDHASDRDVPITELARQELAPLLDRLRRNEGPAGK